jgi:hypothetical protein
MREQKLKRADSVYSRLAAIAAKEFVNYFSPLLVSDTRQLFERGNIILLLHVVGLSLSLLAETLFCAD